MSKSVNVSRIVSLLVVLMAAVVVLSGPAAGVLDLPEPTAEDKKKHKKKKKHRPAVPVFYLGVERCKEKWARYYERFGFRRMEPSELPADFRKDYRIGKIIVAILFLFSRRKPRFIPMKRDGYQAWPTRDAVGTLRQLGPPLGPKTMITRSRKDGDQIVLDK